MGNTGELPDEWSARQRAVWQREETYWKLSKIGDAEGFLALFDDRFVGWPDTEETPVTFQTLKPVIEEWVTDGGSEEFSYQLEPLSVALCGDVAIAYYRAQECRSKTGEEHEYRMTHTWKRNDGEWKIIGGMAAPVDKW